LHSQIQQDHSTRLAAEEFKTQRLRLLHQSSRFRATAEEDQCREQERELKVLVLAAQKGLNWTALDPQLALELARAARDTLMAEEETAKLRVDECESLLATLKDSVDDAHARVEEAHHQIASILTFFDKQGIPINFRPLPFDAELVQDHSTSSASDISSEMESGSDQESASPDEDF
jgi:hypothetical protein